MVIAIEEVCRTDQCCRETWGLGTNTETYKTQDNTLIIWKALLDYQESSVETECDCDSSNGETGEDFCGEGAAP